MDREKRHEVALMVMKLLADEGVNLFDAKRILKDVRSAIDNIAKDLSSEIPMRQVNDKAGERRDDENLWLF